jgi:hypothetical protein
VFEPHRRLAFEADFTSEPEHRRASVEEPAHRRCLERPDAFINQPQRELVASGKTEWRIGEIRQALDLRQKTGGALHRMTSRGIAAGERGFPEMHRAAETFPQAPGKEFPAPDRPVVTVTRAVKAYADHALVPRFPFGEH